MRYQQVSYNAEKSEWSITMTANEWPWMMKQAKPGVKCPDCSTTRVHVKENYIKGGKRYTCLNETCKTETFIVR